MKTWKLSAVLVAVLLIASSCNLFGGAAKTTVVMPTAVPRAVAKQAVEQPTPQGFNWGDCALISNGQSLNGEASRAQGKCVYGNGAAAIPNAVAKVAGQTTPTVNLSGDPIAELAQLGIDLPGSNWKAAMDSCPNGQDQYGQQINNLQTVPYGLVNLCDWGDLDGVQVSLDRQFGTTQIPISFEERNSGKAVAVVSVGKTNVFIGSKDAKPVTVEGVMKITSDYQGPVWVAMAGDTGQFTEFRANNWRGIMVATAWTWGMTLRSEASFNNWPQVKPESPNVGELHIYETGKWGWRPIPYTHRLQPQPGGAAVSTANPFPANSGSGTSAGDAVSTPVVAANPPATPFPTVKPAVVATAARAIRRPTAIPTAIPVAAAVMPATVIDDPRGDGYRAVVKEIGAGTPHWHAQKVYWYPANDDPAGLNGRKPSGMNPCLWVDVIDPATGKRKVGEPLFVSWPSGSDKKTLEAKPGEPYGFCQVMTTWGPYFTARPDDGQPADEVTTGLGSIGRPNWNYHSATGVTWVWWPGSASSPQAGSAAAPAGQPAAMSVVSNPAAQASVSDASWSLTSGAGLQQTFILPARTAPKMTITGKVTQVGKLSLGAIICNGTVKFFRGSSEIPMTLTTGNCVGPVKDPVVGAVKSGETITAEVVPDGSIWQTKATFFWTLQ